MARAHADEPADVEHVTQTRKAMSTDEAGEVDGALQRGADAVAG